MGRKNNRSPKGEEPVSFMYPSLHQEVMDAIIYNIPTTRFHAIDSDQDSTDKYSTHVMGRFKCKSNTCSTDGWSSKKVAILIRKYSRNGYNAVVFNQRCKACNHLGAFELDEDSYVDRVAYRLQKWAGYSMGQPYHDEKEGPPHASHLCEGCKRGYCQRQMKFRGYG